MGEREIAKELLIALINNLTSVSTDFETMTNVAILATRDIVEAFPEDKPHPCGFNEMPDMLEYIPDEGDDE